MTQENQPMKKSLSVANLAAGQVVLAGYNYRGEPRVDKNLFLGFKFNDTWFSTLKHLKEFLGSNSLKELETEAQLRGNGSITAEFRNVEGDYLWGAYLWKGSFKVGTSADRLVLQVA
jgi:hypothetical protein